MKAEYHDSYLGIFSEFLIKKILEPEVINQPTASPKFLPKKNRSGETEYGYIMQPLILDNKSSQVDMRKVNEVSSNVEKDDSKEKPKKKRKGNKEETIATVTKIQSPKLKKAKSESIFQSINVKK